MRLHSKILFAALLLSFAASALSACVVVPEREVDVYRAPPHHHWHDRDDWR